MVALSTSDYVLLALVGLGAAYFLLKDSLFGDAAGGPGRVGNGTGSTYGGGSGKVGPGTSALLWIILYCILNLRSSSRCERRRRRQWRSTVGRERSRKSHEAGSECDDFV
jgi:hypothetical protein